MLVSTEPDLVNRPRLYEPDPGPHLRHPLKPMLERIGVSFRLGRVIQIDVGGCRVILADGATLPWDRLVIALGSQTKRPSMPGIERAFDVGSYDGALVFNRHLKALPAGATITVVGSGFTGLELATELAGRYSVVLIECADVIAPGLGERPREIIARALEDLGVQVQLGTTLDRIDGETTVWCGGPHVARRPRHAGPPGDRA